MVTIKKKKMTLRNEKGFALLAAIIACLILLAVGILIINMSTEDLLSSSVILGNKKSLAATESGIHRLIQDFKPDAATWTTANNYTDCTATIPAYIWRPINAGTDARTQFAICAPTVSNLPPVSIPGYDIKDWAMVRYNATIVGENTFYNSLTKVDIGIGYGPVPQ